MPYRRAFSRRALFIFLLVFVAGLDASAAQASDWLSLKEALNLRPILDTRLRYERATQRDRLNDAQAVTLRARGGIEVSPLDRLSVLVEGEGVVALVEAFDDTIGATDDRPIVADPEALELNRARMILEATDWARLTVGRQHVSLDDERFIGIVDFRQNQQTYDALTVGLELPANVADRKSVV